MANKALERGKWHGIAKETILALLQRITLSFLVFFSLCRQRSPRARERTRSERDVKKHASSTHSAVFAFLDSWRRLSVSFQSVANARERGENLYIATALKATFVRIFAPFVPVYPFFPGNEKRERWFRKKSGGKTLRRLSLVYLSQLLMKSNSRMRDSVYKLRKDTKGVGTVSTRVFSRHCPTRASRTRKALPMTSKHALGITVGVASFHRASRIVVLSIYDVSSTLHCDFSK